MVSDEVANLALRMLQLGDGHDAATVVAALGRAAAGAVTFSVHDPAQRPTARQLFIDQFKARCDEYDEMLIQARSCS